ncbi:MAG: aminotransferase [Crocinitomicaceae bacterium]|nr:aminotransferase [Crocinitomicaceae bacterium]
MRNAKSTSKLPNVGTTIFTEMSAMAQAHGALNMSQGFPDFQPPKPLQAAVVAAMAKGRNQYAPMAGDIRLREWIAADAERRSGACFHPDTEVTIGAGASSLIFATIQALIHPGDEVMVLTPCYDLYEPAVELAGGRLVCVPLQADTHRLDLEAMKASWTESIRMVVINVPNNPTGSTWSREDLHGLAELVEGTNALVLSDEVYGPMHHDGRDVLSVTHEPRLRERAVVFASFGKILHCTGWKIGYATAPAALTGEIRKVHQYDVFSTGAPFQAGIEAFLNSDAGATHLSELAPFYQSKRDRLIEGLKGSRWQVSPAEGGYFQLLGYGAFDERDDRTATADWCSRAEGLALIPLSPFYPEGENDSKLVRICFAKNNDTIDQGIQRLLKISNG